MPVAVKNQNWIQGVYDPLTGTHDPGVAAQVCASFPASAFPDGYLRFAAALTDLFEAQADQAFVFGRTAAGEMTEPVMATGSPLTVTFGAEWLADVETVFIDIACTEDVTDHAAWASAVIQLDMSPNYFPESALGIYITPQQLRQFKNMYPDCVSDAYRAAVGELTANIGNIFDMAAMLGEPDENKKDDTIRWILQVLTAYNIASPSLNYSEPLAAAYEKVAQTIIKLKGGVVSLEEPAPYRTDSQNANAEVITSRYKYLG